MPVDKELVAKKLDILNKYVSAIEQMEFDEQTFVENTDVHDLITFRLQQAVETCIDITTHIIAQSTAERKETAKDAFSFLGIRGIIDKELSERMRKAADFRNRVVHGYNDFDFRLLFRDYKQNVADLRNFGKQVLQYINLD